MKKKEIIFLRNIHTASRFLLAMVALYFGIWGWINGMSMLSPIGSGDGMINWLLGNLIAYSLLLFLL